MDHEAFKSLVDPPPPREDFKPFKMTKKRQADLKRAVERLRALMVLEEHHSYRVHGGIREEEYVYERAYLVRYLARNYRDVIAGEQAIA